MNEFSELLKAIGSVLWPTLFGVIAFVFYKPLRSVIESTRGRKFTLKVAGNELSVEEATVQQGNILMDLQAKVAELEKRIEAQPTPAQTHGQPAPLAKPSQVRTMLWVDDTPKNNSYIAASLGELGISVVTAFSTEDAMRQFSAGKFDRVVSDMARPEGDKAGIELTKRIRAIDPVVPVVIYCGRWAATNLKAEALAAGASGITSSSSTLMQLLSIPVPGAFV